MSNILSSHAFDFVKPVRPAAPYIGGKKILAKRIIEQINQTPHRIYAEPFVGMGGIFFRRNQRPKSEIINDWSQDVATFFRVLQYHYSAFAEHLEWTLCSRVEFERLLRMDADQLTDIQRAVRFYFVQRTSFGGKVNRRTFGVSIENSARFSPIKLREQLTAIRDRLAGVLIERLQWSEFISRYNREHMLFYLDPPYFNCENDYGNGMFGRGDFAKMAEQLRKIKGRFILSINDKPQVQEIFQGFQMERVQCTYTVGGGHKASEFGELVISN